MPIGFQFYDQYCIKVLDFHHPHHLKEMMSHCLEIPNEGVTLEQVLSDCRETMKYGVRTGLLQPSAKQTHSTFKLAMNLFYM